MAVLDGNIVTVALPTMARQFAVAPESATGSSTPSSSRSPFRCCRWPRSATCSATGASIGGGSPSSPSPRSPARSAPTFAALTFARLVQGLGAAGIMSVNIALIRFIYPHSRLGQGVGNMAVVVAVASAASPSVAAAILSVASWHWLFLINVPIGALALAMAARTLPATPRAAGRLDLISVVLNALAFGLFIAGVNRIGQGGSAIAGADRDRPGRGDRRGPGQAAAQALRAAAAGRSLAPAGVRAVAGDVDHVVRSAEPGHGGAAVLLRGHARPLRRRHRPSVDAMAGREPR